MSALRRVTLACYPRWWRAEHGDEVIGLLLDSAEDNGHADYRDLLNLAIHGLRLRLQPDTGPVVGLGVRDRVSVIAVALLVPISVTLLVFGEWAPWDAATSFDPSPVANLTTGAFCYLAGLLAAGFVATRLGPEPWFFYRQPDQVELRTSGGVLMGVALTAVAVVLLVAGHRASAAAFAANAVPWLLLYASRLTHASSLLSAPVLVGVVVTAMLTTLSAVILRRRIEAGDQRDGKQAATAS